jgi:hypothetical protein
VTFSVDPSGAAVLPTLVGAIGVAGLLELQATAPAMSAHTPRRASDLRSIQILQRVRVVLGCEHCSRGIWKLKRIVAQNRELGYIRAGRPCYHHSALADSDASAYLPTHARTLMKKTTSMFVLIAGLLLAGAPNTAAQTPLAGKLFVNINGGGQMTTDEFTTGNALTIYQQSATWTTTETVDSGGLFDISVGYRVWHDIGLALGFSSFKSSGSAAGVALIPDPVFFNRPHTVTLDLSTAPRTDRNVYLVAVWFLPVHDKIDLAISIGPSFTRVKQQVVTDIVIPAGTSNANPVVVTQSGTAKGLNVGVDGTYMFLKWIGAGAFIRYNGGSIDLDQVTGLKAGGAQGGIGARLRF